MPVTHQMASWTVKITVGTLYLDNGNSLQNVRPIQNQKYTRTAVETREALANYLATDGSVSDEIIYALDQKGQCTFVPT